MSNLSHLNDGDTAYIIRVRGSQAFRLRLEEMGFVPGQEVKRLYAAPLGSPIIFSMMGQQIALRQSEAEGVAVAPTLSEVPFDQRETAEVYEIGAHTPTPTCPRGLENVPGVREHPHAAQCDPALCTTCPSCGHTSRRRQRKTADLTVALIGNPNCGKTAFFNAASGGHEHTGNYAGVTVSSVESVTTFEGMCLKIIDLPGTYSLRAFSPEEAFVASELATGNIDVVINVLDTGNLERNLLLTIQLQELGIPVVGALNLYDEFEESGSTLDRQRLEHLLGMPLIPCVAKKGRGIAEVLRAAIKVAQAPPKEYPVLRSPHQPDHHALVHALLEGIYTLRPGRTARLTAVVDRYLAHRPTAFVAFLLIMWGIFYATFNLGQYPMDWMEQGVDYLRTALGAHLPTGWLRDLLLSGIIGGVGSVIVFLPNILILYFFISILEDSGYLARAALLFDPLLRRVGLHGKSFFPMLTGFGCNVPAIMATRTIESRKSRLMTMMLAPFMSCSARLPIYTIFTLAFFPECATSVMMGLYAVGILVAMSSAWLLNKYFHRSEESHFVMEIPLYRRPSLTAVLTLTWEKGREYLRKMGGIILITSIAMWALGYFPHDDSLTPAQQQEQSMLGTLGHAIAPAVAPLGFDWRMGVGLLSGMGAKEMMVSTLGVLYNASEGSDDGDDADNAALVSALSTGTTRAVAVAYMLFALLYFPCFATLAAIRAESGRWRYALFAAIYSTAVAYIVAFVAYHLMR